MVRQTIVDVPPELDEEAVGEEFTIVGGPDLPYVVDEAEPEGPEPRASSHRPMSSETASQPRSVRGHVGRRGDQGHTGDVTCIDFSYRRRQAQDQHRRYRRERLPTVKLIRT